MLRTVWHVRINTDSHRLTQYIRYGRSGASRISHRSKFIIDIVNHPTAYVIAQQYSSSPRSFVSTRKYSSLFKTLTKLLYFLGALEKLRKATINFIVSVRPRGRTRLRPFEFPCNLIFIIFETLLRKIKFD
jgi:hypothetical protein